MGSYSKLQGRTTCRSGFVVVAFVTLPKFEFTEDYGSVCKLKQCLIWSKIGSHSYQFKRKYKSFLYNYENAKRF